LPMVDSLQEVLFSKQALHKVYEQAAKIGFITMQQDGILKVIGGETTLDEIIRVTTE
jgi:type II secretory ATPase GspE/PulE/Tfp pilus assembly ATPase PilB-like protein